MRSRSKLQDLKSSMGHLIESLKVWNEVHACRVYLKYVEQKHVTYKTEYIASRTSLLFPLRSAEKRRITLTSGSHFHQAPAFECSPCPPHVLFLILRVHTFCVILVFNILFLSPSPSLPLSLISPMSIPPARVGSSHFFSH